MVDVDDCENVILTDREFEFAMGEYEGKTNDEKNERDVRDSVEDIPKIIRSLFTELALLYKSGYLESDEWEDGWKEITELNWLDHKIRNDLLDPQEISPSPVKDELTTEDDKLAAGSGNGNKVALVGNKFGNALRCLYSNKKDESRQQERPIDRIYEDSRTVQGPLDREVAELIYGFMCAFIGHHPFDVNLEEEKSELLAEELNQLYDNKLDMYKKEKAWRKMNSATRQEEHSKYSEIFEEFSLEEPNRIVKSVLAERGIETSDLLDQKFKELEIYSGSHWKNMKESARSVLQEYDTRKEAEEAIRQTEIRDALINKLDFEELEKDVEPGQLVEMSAREMEENIRKGALWFLDVNTGILLAAELRDTFEEDARELNEIKDADEVFEYVFNNTNIEERRVGREEISQNCATMRGKNKKYVTQKMNRLSGKTKEYWRYKPLVEDVDSAGDKEWKITQYGIVLGWYIFEVERSVEEIHRVAFENQEIIWYILGVVEDVLSDKGMY
jgi:hypothetical protein